MFIAIAKLVPDCNDEEKVRITFDILGGLSPVSSIKELLNDPEQRKNADEVKNDSWKGASTWVAWWLRPNHLAKLCRAFSGRLFIFG